MEFEWGTAIIGMLVLALFTVPFVIDRRSRIARKKGALLSLQQLAGQHNCRIDRHELCGDLSLGLDESKNVVFLATQGKEGRSAQHVSLSEMRSCSMVNATRSKKQNAGAGVLTERIQLSLLPKDQNKSELRLELFGAGSGLNLNGELQFAEKWAKLIQDRLKNGTK